MCLVCNSGHLQFIWLSVRLFQWDISLTPFVQSKLSPLPLTKCPHLPFLSQGVQIQSDPEVSTEGVIQTEVNRTVSLLCLPDRGSETPADEELVWLRNGAVVSLMEGNRKGRSSVCISPIIHEDNGATFTCHLSRNATVKASVTLNVTCESLQMN